MRLDMRLEMLRAEINKIDNNILLLLRKRFKLGRKIAQLKKELNLPIEDKRREAKVLERMVKKAKNLDIDRLFISNFFKKIINESKRIQKSEI